MQLLYAPAPREIQFNCPWCTTRLALPEEDFNKERAVLCPRCNNPIDLAVQRRIDESAGSEAPPPPAQAPPSAPAQAPPPAPAQAPPPAPAQAPPPAPGQAPPALPPPTAPAQAPPITPPQRPQPTPPQPPQPTPPQAPQPQTAQPPDRPVTAPGRAAPQRERRAKARRKRAPPPTAPAEPPPLPPLRQSQKRIAVPDFDPEKPIDIDAIFESERIHVADVDSLMSGSDLWGTDESVRIGPPEGSGPRIDMATGVVECPSCKYENTPIPVGFEFGKKRKCTWCAKPLPK